MQKIKCATLTFHRTTNYGAVFQTFALQKALESLGISNEVLDYRNPTIETRYESRNLKYYFNPKNILKILLKNAYIRDNRKNFNDFSKKYIRISSKSYTPDDIALSDEIYDYFIVGSDQVWNPECMGYDANYLLHFVNRASRNSYAASFGYSSFKDSMYDWFRQDLSRFSNISLREVSGNRIINSILGKSGYVVLDPTLLLNREWIEISNSVPRLISEEYVLVYLMKETNSIFRKVKAYAKSKGLKIVYINDRLFPHLGLKNVFRAHPIEWLNLMFYSKCIFTNSFHGTAFAINFNKPFWTELLPEPSKTNSRIVDLLSMTNLQARILRPNIMPDDNEIDFTPVNGILENRKSLSMQYLNRIFK